MAKQSNHGAQNDLKSTPISRKYVCGCGKTYTSYPAYSTHRKTKHNNIDIQGSRIPKSQVPKRGRPCYDFVKREKEQDVKQGKVNQYYQGLTVIQLGLLKLNQKFQGKILAEANEQQHFQLPQQLVSLASHQTTSTQGENLTASINLNEISANLPSTQSLQITRLMILFIELMTTHMSKPSAQALIEFITEFIIYTSSLQKIPIDSSDSIEEPNQQRDLFDVAMFNEYFSRQENKDYVNNLAQKYNLNTQFFITSSVILSHWLYQLGYCQKVIKVKSPEKSSVLAY